MSITQTTLFWYNIVIFSELDSC